MKRPAGIVYGVDDVPPPGVLLLGGLQHVGLVSIFLLVPVLAGRPGARPSCSTSTIDDAARRHRLFT